MDILSVDGAIARVLGAARPLPPSSFPLDAALGRVLAEEIVSDIDSPPFDKALMDGYAIVASDLASGEATLEVIEEIAAGATPAKSVTTGRASRIMTGAPIPAGADAVVMVERSKMLENTRVQLTDKPIRPGQNILSRATSMRLGEVVLNRGARLRPMEIGLLAEVGKAQVLAHPAPRCAIVSTGNELVPVDHLPAAGQIRNSNSSMLHAQCQRAGGDPSSLGIALDDERSLRESFMRGLEADVLLISGGVSAGRFDLAPQVLDSLGAINGFRQVLLKPGKPLWFGHFEHANRRTLIFGLPGNPVSSLVCFELFVVPALAVLKGEPASPRQAKPARLAKEWNHRSDRPTYHPASLTTDAQGELQATPLNWKGSADLRTLAKANALLVLPPGEASYEVGSILPAIRLD